LTKSYANITEKTTVINQDVQLSGHSTAVLDRESIAIQQSEPYIQKPIEEIKRYSTSKNQIPVLDGVRAIACLAVLSWHLNQITPALRGINNYLAALVYFGDSGVMLFFLLSGFLLFLPYAKALLFDSPWPASYRFYLRRIFRILPGYFVTLFLVVIFFHPEYMQWEFLSSAFNFRITKFADPVFWTLGVEMVFYLLLPPLAWIFRLVVRRGPVRWRMLRLTLCLLLMAAWGMLSNYWGLYLALTSQLGFSIPRDLLGPLLPIIHGDVGNFAEVFAVGMLLCMVYTFTQYASTGERWRKRIVRLVPLMWPGGLIVLAFISLCHLYQVRTFVRIDSPHIFPFLDPYAQYITNYWFFYQAIVYAIGYGLCMWAVLYGSGYIKKLLELSIVRRIGYISFSLYLWHLPLVFLFADHIAPTLVQHGFHRPMEYLSLWCWTIAVILPVSLFMYRYVEKPGIRVGRWIEEVGTRAVMRVLQKG
jgi:peptidoglycan/LPS O-acetylase OafA/YrhL